MSNQPECNVEVLDWRWEQGVVGLGGGLLRWEKMRFREDTQNSRALRDDLGVYLAVEKDILEIEIMWVKA